MVPEAEYGCHVCAVVLAFAPVEGAFAGLIGAAKPLPHHPFELEAAGLGKQSFPFAFYPRCDLDVWWQACSLEPEEGFLARLEGEGDELPPFDLQDVEHLKDCRGLPHQASDGPRVAGMEAPHDELEVRPAVWCKADELTIEYSARGQARRQVTELGEGCCHVGAVAALQHRGEC